MGRATNKGLAIGLAVLVIAVGVGVAAIGRSGGTTATAAPGGRGAQPFSGGNARAGTDFQQFADCMEEHGVTLSPGARPDRSDTDLQTALEACRRYMPRRPTGPGGPPPNGTLPDGTVPPRSDGQSTQNGQATGSTL